MEIDGNGSEISEEHERGLVDTSRWMCHKSADQRDGAATPHRVAQQKHVGPLLSAIDKLREADERIRARRIVLGTKPPHL